MIFTLILTNLLLISRDIIILTSVLLISKEVKAKKINTIYPVIIVKEIVKF